MSILSTLLTKFKTAKSFTAESEKYKANENLLTELVNSSEVKYYEAVFKLVLQSSSTPVVYELINTIPKKQFPTITEITPDLNYTLDFGVDLSEYDFNKIFLPNIIRTLPYSGSTGKDVFITNNAQDITIVSEDSNPIDSEFFLHIKIFI